MSSARRLKKPELRNPLVMKRISEMRARGHGYKNIAKAIEEDFGISVSFQTIKNMLPEIAATSFDIVEKADKEQQEELKEFAFNHIEQLKRLNKEMWKMFFKAQNILEKELIKEPSLKSFREMVKLADHLLKQIDTQAGMIDNLRDKINVKQQFNFIDASLQMNNMLVKLEDEGYIKILKKRKMEEQEAKC